MMRTIEYYKARLNMLEQRSPVESRGIIAKLYRKIRALENAQKGQN